jgi:uncharacterized membrane protein
MSNKRRFFIIFISLTIGSMFSIWIVKQRMGSLSPQAYGQLIMNFIFAGAIVVGIAMLFKKMNKDDANRDDASKDQK